MDKPSVGAGASPSYPLKMKKASLRAESSNEVLWSEYDVIDEGRVNLDMDYLVKTLSGIKAKGVRPDFIGSIIVHYASKWLPDLSDDYTTTTQLLMTNPNPIISSSSSSSPRESCSMTAQWLKKRFFVENLVGILPPENNSVPCGFLLRLLRTANMVEAEPRYRAELERKVARQLDQASLKDLMIPSFTHTSTTLLDVGLVLRLVKRFLVDDQAAGSGLVKVAKLIDAYLAEVALDSGLTVDEFMALAGALPGHARSMDDGLYRGIDTYLKAHPNVPKQERTNMCRLMDSRKLSSEASLHASQNERLPVRAVIQVVLSEQTKLLMSRSYLDWSGSFTAPRSPTNSLDPSAAAGRCHSKREAAAAQQILEIRRLKEDVQRLQGQCDAMQAQIEKMAAEKKKISGGFFRWPKKIASFTAKTTSSHHHDQAGEPAGFGRFTPVDIKARLVKGRRTPPKWRKSMS